MVYDARSGRVERCGKLLSMAGSISDITERKLAEHALKESDEALKRVVATSLDGYWRLDMHGRLLDVNLTYSQQSGYTREELLGLHVSALVATEETDAAECIQKVMTSGHDQYLTTHRRKDGALWYVEVSITFDEIAGGQFFIFIRNVTERVLESRTRELRASRLSDRLEASEAVVRESEQRLALAAEAANLGIWIHDLARNEVWASDRWRAIFGFTSSEQVDAASMLQRVHSEDRDLCEQRMALVRQGRAEYETSFRIVLPDGKLRWIESRGRIEFDAGGHPLLIRGVSLDITVRKQSELRVEQQRLEMTRLSRIATLGELSGAMAHELNQPLATILINAQVAQRLLAQESVDLNEVSEVLQEIIDEDKRAGEIIWRLRELFAKRKTVRQSIDLNQLMLKVSHILRNELIGRSVMLRLDLTSDSAVVNANRVELQQVVINLVMNACDAMQANATSDRLVFLRTAISGDERVQVSVIDQGSGLGDGDLAKIFEAFYTTKEQGMGLGLSICRNIVSANDGQLWGENNAERGASFHFSMPLQTTEVV